MVTEGGGDILVFDELEETYKACISPLEETYKACISTSVSFDMLVKVVFLFGYDYEIQWNIGHG